LPAVPEENQLFRPLCVWPKLQLPTGDRNGGRGGGATQNQRLRKTRGPDVWVWPGVLQGGVPRGGVSSGGDILELLGVGPPDCARRILAGGIRVQVVPAG